MGAKAVVGTVDIVLCLLLLDELDLVRDPVFLHVSGLVIDFLDLLLDVVTMVLDGANVLITITTTSKVSTLTVETINLQCLLLDPQQTCLDVLLNLLNITLFFLELRDQILKLLLKNFVLSCGVQVIKTNSGDFIGVVLNVNLFLRDVLVGCLGLLVEVSR